MSEMFLVGSKGCPIRRPCCLGSENSRQGEEEEGKLVEIGTDRWLEMVGVVFFRRIGEVGTLGLGGLWTELEKVIGVWEGGGGLWCRGSWGMKVVGTEFKGWWPGIFPRLAWGR